MRGIASGIWRGVVSAAARAGYPWHALQLSVAAVTPDSRFVVCHGSGMKCLQCVCLLDAGGHAVHTATGAFHAPTQLALTGAGFVLVLDAARVALLDPDLAHVRDVVVGAEHGLREPRQLHWDDASRRLYVAERAGRLLVFQLTAP